MGAKLKRDADDIVIKWIMVGRVKPVKSYPCVIKFTFYEPPPGRDQDNIESARKFILDALQKKGIIKNDNHKHVDDIPTTTVYDSCVKENMVRVEIIENQHYQEKF